MAKFGELIAINKPILINFYRKQNDKTTTLLPVLNEVAQTLKDEAKVIKINVDENRQLCEALKITKLPTLLIYKNGEMLWRHHGYKQAAELIELLQSHR